MAGFKRSCARWLSLPMELLLRVLALLDEQELMTARLVCREWRMASLTFMTHLNLNAWRWSAGMRSSTAPLEALSKCLQALPNLNSLAYKMSYPEDARLLSLPSCASALKGLHIDFDFPHSSNCSVGPTAVAMASIARLTGLAVFSALATSEGFKCAQFISSSSMILAQCTGLCKVNLAWCGVEDWLLLLPLLAGLPHLRALGDLLLCSQESVAIVASMTQLTFVRGTDDQEAMHLQPLFRLPALRGLALTVECEGNWPTLVSAAPGMPQLAHFSIAGYECPGSSELASVLAPLSGLTKLDLWARDMPPLPHYLWQSCLSNLQDLRWRDADVCGGGVAFPHSLRHLELVLADWDDPEMPELLQGVAALTRLTALSLSVDCPACGWVTDAISNATWRSASFLTGLTRLVHLGLDHFLHVGNVEGDVECLAVLTGLRSLQLCGSCACHGGSEDTMGEQEPDGWWWGECGFKAFEAQGGFLRLLPLAGVTVLDALGPWEVLKGSTLEAEINAVKRLLGRPPLKFDWVRELGNGGPGMGDDGF